MFIRTLKVKIYKKMAGDDRKSYFGYLNQLVDKCNNTYHLPTGVKSIGADYSAFTKDVKTNPKASKFKFGDRVGITKFKNIFSKGFTKNWSREIFDINSVSKANPWMYKIKDSNGEKLVGSFYKKELSSSIL